uniref:Putative secreted protein n=1 Tax=Anopheles darlingi TaxID=43151 RepID=A0A2M4D9I6_ANODA
MTYLCVCACVSLMYSLARQLTRSAGRSAQRAGMIIHSKSSYTSTGHIKITITMMKVNKLHSFLASLGAAIQRERETKPFLGYPCPGARLTFFGLCL